MNRRQFIRASGTGLAAAACRAARGAEPTSPPNILVILTDQQHAGMLSCAGNPWLKTPALDRLAAHSVRFERAYAANPVCVPSRFSLQTGQYPGLVGVRANSDSGRSRPYPDLEHRTLGWLLKAAGYETVYGGKVHLPTGAGMKDIQRLGYRNLTGNEREGLAKACVEFLKQPHERPFFLFTSFINPHDICYMAIQAQREQTRVPPPLTKALRRPDGMTEEAFYATACPPAPDDFEPSQPEPRAVTAFLKQRGFKWHAREHWSIRDWRLHRWAYCRLTEHVDAQIGQVLDALEQNGLVDNTLVVFTSDHGDMDGSHRMEHKSVFYEHAIHIPLIIKPPGAPRPGTVDANHLISNGLDLLPTLCDYAGARPPEGLPGRSLRPLIAGDAVTDWRQELVVEGELGVYFLSGTWKYCRLDFAGDEEVLFNLAEDPGEMQNLASDPTHRETLMALRHRLSELHPAAQRQPGSRAQR